MAGLRLFSGLAAIPLTIILYNKYLKSKVANAKTLKY